MLRNFSNLRSLVRAPAHASKPHQNVVKFSPAFVNITVTNFRFFSSKNDGDSKKVLDSGMTPIQDIANSIDTTLTPEQQEYVNKLKKQLRGGVNSPRSIYREVPLPHEVVGMGNFMPRIAENAEELIDYALSHIPPKAGKRGTRRAKRMELKWSTKRKYDAIRKEQIRQANLRRHVSTALGFG